MPAAALAFAAAAAAPGSAAATPTGLSHGVSIGRAAQGGCFAVLGCGLGALARVNAFLRAAGRVGLVCVAPKRRRSRAGLGGVVVSKTLLLPLSSSLSLITSSSPGCRCHPANVARPRWRWGGGVSHGGGARRPCPYLDARTSCFL